MQEDCAANVDCSYYSFDYESQLCHQYANCPDQSTEFCPRCISGQPGCGVGTTISAENNTFINHYYNERVSNNNMLALLQSPSNRSISHGHWRVRRIVPRRSGVGLPESRHARSSVSPELETDAFSSGIRCRGTSAARY